MWPSIDFEKHTLTNMPKVDHGRGQPQATKETSPMAHMYIVYL